MYIMSRTHIKAWRLDVPMTDSAFSSILGRSVPAMAGMVGAAFLIAIISLSFQTMTQSKILTPAMIGFDAVFMGTQTLLVFLFGTTGTLFANPFINYLVSAGTMVTVSFFMYRAILRKSRDNTIFLLMFGLVLSGIVGNLARYLQTIMTMYEFNHVQAAVNVTVNNMNTRIIWLVMPLMALLCVAIIWRHRKYNVMVLGRDVARSLGINYERELHLNLIFIAIGMSLSTALIGSLTFLGLLAVNLSRMILKTHRHLPLFIASGLVAAVALVFGQTAVELLEGGLPVTVIINLVGCTYLFIYILRENKV
ncbi:MAG: iron chelate uptake ABC transporter family permease subunit [Turicibacter sp.]|nr:iron chelate uptake ABC transporter family permease subunit [Turicibacter sp.]